MEHRCPQCGATLPEGVPAWVRRPTLGQAMTREPVTIRSPADLLIHGG